MTLGAEETAPGRAAGARLGIAWARLRQALGALGIVGLLLLAIAATLAASAWSERGRARELTVVLSAIKPARAFSEANPRPAPSPLVLPRRSEMPMLVARLERAAADSGLPWAAAEYRAQAPSELRPGMVEIHCKFTAPYPKLRQLIGLALSTLPASTFKQMSFRRASSAVADVEATLVLAIFVSEQ